MNKKTIFILGGTGFIGRALVERYLRNNWRVVVSTRSESLKKAKNKLLFHGFHENLLNESISKNLFFALNVELTDRKWSQLDSWFQLFKKMNIPPSSVLGVVNLVGETSKSADKILSSNISALENAFVLVRYIKTQNKKSLFANMGSAVEKKYHKRPSPYEHAKKVVRKKIRKSRLCDFHFVAQYVKGRGEQKMKAVAPILWGKLKFSRRWLFGFSVSVLDVDELANVIFYFLEDVSILPQEQKPIEVNVTNGELVFGEMVKNLLPENERVIPKAIIPDWLERPFLLFYSVVVPMFMPNDQLARRLASFAKRGFEKHKKLNETKGFKTAREIKALISDSSYLVLETTPDLIISNKKSSIVYVLKERSQDELRRIVQKALTPSG